MTSYNITEKAYAKVAFHAAKYPHKQVNGVFIGKTENGVIELKDAIPLLHHWTSLSPSMEIGLDLARNYAQSIGLNIVAYYQASENVNDTSLAPVGEKVAESIRKSFTNAIAFVVDSSKLASGEPALIPYLPQGNSTSWRPADGAAQLKNVSQVFSTRVLELIREGRKHQELGDFDDHLEDVSIDWLRNSDCNVES